MKIRDAMPFLGFFGTVYVRASEDTHYYNYSEFPLLN